VENSGAVRSGELAGSGTSPRQLQVGQCKRPAVVSVACPARAGSGRDPCARPAQQADSPGRAQHAQARRSEQRCATTAPARPPGKAKATAAAISASLWKTPLSTSLYTPPCARRLRVTFPRSPRETKPRLEEFPARDRIRKSSS